MAHLGKFCVLTVFSGAFLIGTAQAPAQYGRPAALPSLDDTRLTESSGLAPSRRHAGLFYTHNDSGDTARFFAFTPGKAGVREIAVEGARNIDWEDMASAQVRGRSYLYFADVGDNSQKREFVTVYRIPEPDLNATKVKPDRTYTLRYPDGAENCETLLIHPRTGEAFLVAKSTAEESGVYAAGVLGDRVEIRLRRVGSIRIPVPVGQARLTTGGSVSPDGSSVIIRTYVAAYVWQARKFGDWYRNAPTLVPLALERQGESIAFSADGTAVLTTSEGRPMTVHRLSVQKE